MEPTHKSDTEPPISGETTSLVMAEIASLVAELHSGTAVPVGPQSDLSDLGLDSLSLVELLARLGQRFDVTLPEDTLLNATTVADWDQAVRRAQDEAKYRSGHNPTVSRVTSLVRPEGEPWPASARTMPEVLQWHVEMHPDLVSISLLDNTIDALINELTYGDLADAASAVASGLLAAGLHRGDRVAIMLPTSQDYFVVFMGVWLACLVPVPIYPPAHLSQLEEHLRNQARLLDNAGATALVTVPEAMGAARLLRPLVPSLRIVRTPAALTLAGALPLPLPVVAPGDVALIQYTSGSTGDPKGVVLTHAQLLANVRAMGQAAKLTTSDILVSWLPLYHDMGLIGMWHAPMYFGIPIIVMSPLIFLARPAIWLETISHYGATLSAGPNFAFQSCVDRISDAELDQLDLSSWRIAFNGSEPVSPTTIARFAERFGRCGFRPTAMCPAYGLAEVGVGVAFTPLEQGPRLDIVLRTSLQREGRAVPAEAGEPGGVELVGCGIPLPGYEIRVAGPRGDELPDRCEGAVECRGPSATTGYFANESANRQLWRRGWLSTGDLGYMANGELFLTGREKDLIIRGGHNLHPEELERALEELPGVCSRGVAVFASADPGRGTERLIAVVETDLKDSSARTHLKTQIVDRSVTLLDVTPDEVVLTAPGALLRTANGKIRRAATREAFESGRLGRHPAPIAVQMARLAWVGLRPGSRRLRTSLVTWFVAAYMWALVIGICTPVALLVHLPLSPRTRWRLARGAGDVLHEMAAIGLRIEGSFPAGESAAVIVANHASFVDGLVMLLAAKDPVVFVTSTDLKRQPIVGSVLQRLGCIFVERDQQALTDDAVERMTDLLRRKQRLVIFPEGTINRAPGLRPFHLGAFAAATAAGCPVVPVGIRGTRNIVRPGSRLPRRAEVTVVIGSPVTPTGSDFAASVHLRDSARSAISKLSDEPFVA
jgi:1-acyl-sn-glycerol-3-phosphate acyltransferase